MAKRNSAGILLYRARDGELEIFLVHPGGPYWKNKDAGAWSIPKGEFDADADPLAAAQREFHEETGSRISGEFVALNPLKQAAGKLVHAWAVQGDLAAASVASNTFSMEWPPNSGKQQEFPEVDRGEWFTIDAAKEKILKGQRGFLEQLQTRLLATCSAEPPRPSRTAGS
ncbi:MAG: NUDIX domain-containing protein [Pseudomonadota bacterium]|nr:NUDIX domain-containing protein [Pseudomonadota bacterium]